MTTSNKGLISKTLATRMAVCIEESRLGILAQQYLGCEFQGFVTFSFFHCDGKKEKVTKKKETRYGNNNLRL